MVPIPVPTYDEGVRPLKEAKRYWDARGLANAQEEIKSVQKSLLNPSLYEFLKRKYSDETILERCGEIYPVAAYPAPDSQQGDPDSVLRRLTPRFPDDRDLTPKDGKYRELIARSGRPLADRITFTMKNLWVEAGDKLGLDCELGSYFRALDTCDSLEWEILGEIKSHEVSGDFDQRLQLRRETHEKVKNPLRSGLFRSASIGISTLIVYRDEDTFQLWIRKRSGTHVAIQPNLISVIPSFTFQPATHFFEKEFSVIHNIFREYLEEIFSRPEPGEGEVDWRYFYSDSRLQYLFHLMESGEAKLYLSGVVVNLLTLRPEICTVLLIRSSEWYPHHAWASEAGRFRLNLEWDTGVEATEDLGTLVACVPFAATDRELMGQAPLSASQMSPPSAATFWLGVDLLRKLL